MNRGDAEALRLNQLTEQIIGAAIEVHSHLGPGLLESVYETCLCREFSLRGLSFRRQVEVPIEYKHVRLESGFRLDLLVEESVIVELKTVEALNAVHTAQLLSHLRLMKLSVGLLMNFYVSRLTDGIRRIVNDFPDSSATSRLSG